jgi:hypothetical protein
MVKRSFWILPAPPSSRILDVSWAIKERVGEASPLEIMDWKIASLDAMGQNCANCDSPFRIEMHHVKHVKTINPKLSKFDQALARINRKQVPLCVNCHRLVHKGTYKGLPLRHYYYIPFQGEAKWS